MSARTLTPRMRQIADLIAHGLPNREIAKQLGITVNTVKAHAMRIYDRLDLVNRSRRARVVNMQKALER